MKISTKGRYALRVMIELAHAPSDHYTAMKTVAEHQDISLKYLEKILPALVSGKLIEGVTGKGGGYRLTRKASEYSVGEILRATEGEFAPVTCMECGAMKCPREATCPTIGMWRGLGKVISDYFDGIALSDLLNGLDTGECQYGEYI